MTKNVNHFGGSTFSFMWESDALSCMRSMRALGLNDFDVIMVPGHLWHDELSSAQRASLAATLKQEDIRVESMNLPALDHNLASRVPEARTYSIELFKRAMQLGADLGARAVVAVPGRVSSLFPPPQVETEKLLADSLEQLLAVADALDLTVLIESHPQTPIPTVDKIESFLTRLDHPRLKVAYDVSNAEFVAEDQVDAIRRLAPRIGQIHLSDGTRTRWRHDRVGLGSVRFGDIMKVLDEVGFQGTRVLEIISPTPIEDIKASLASLNAYRDVIASNNEDNAAVTARPY
ncbi:fructoselysine 3-epimerase [Caballeronia temeraria]|uniref:Fructoselysine 3-epimerase n=1 Tax=Caballeronia temeraria TaxID=1777137 RepID=A0A158DLR0_9BURK|nr:sugar phosphate isomerase/epimerase family protein [Caballeronia temeraria]SAK95370.1 fructoselysine 3-epimerase [Caballeronia temeraria]